MKTSLKYYLKERNMDLILKTLKNIYFYRLLPSILDQLIKDKSYKYFDINKYD